MDPIGDVTSGEARAYLGDAEPTETPEPSGNVEMEAYRAETAGDALDATDASGELRPAAKLERLQKILSRAGIASRRRAEEMIVAGSVMVNGQVVTALGSKADPARDHIRVDGKLLHGAERHRYFVLNKPKGYVTTVSDPEGRPTVMEFFANKRERLYPVGRLDYQSEGLLLMTNDGELANLLTKAGVGRGEDLSGEGGRPAQRRGAGAAARRRDDRARRDGIGAGADGAGADSTGARGRQSLVRGGADRGAQSRTAQDVFCRRAFC